MIYRTRVFTMFIRHPMVFIECMYTFRGSNSIFFLPCVTIHRVDYKWQEFAPIGANSFLQELTPF